MKQALKIIFLAIFIVLLNSCKDSKTAKKTIDITVLGENSSNLQAMESLKNEYEKINNVKIVFKPNTFEDAFNKANNDFLHKTGIYDIILQYNFSLSSYVRNSYVYNIEDLVKDLPDSLKSFESDLFENAWKEVGFYYKDFKEHNKGIVKVGYPFAANTMILVCNKNMFENNENKIEYEKKYNEPLTYPKTWEQYKNIAEFFTNKEKGTYGICLQGASGGWLYYEYCNFLYGLNGKIFEKKIGWEGDENTEIKINTKEAYNATEYYIKLKKFNAGNYSTIDATEQINILKKGNVAMGIVWSDYLFNFIYGENNKINDNFDFVPIPGTKSALAGGSFYINKSSKHPVDAAKYIMYLMQEKNQIKLARNGLCSPLKSTYKDSIVKKIPYSNALETSLKRGVYMFEAGPESDLVSQVITNYIQKAWEGKISIKNALKSIEIDIEKGRKDIYKNLK